MAYVVVEAALGEERAMLLTVRGEVSLKGGNEELFSGVKTLARQNAWPGLEHVDHDIRLKVAVGYRWN